MKNRLADYTLVFDIKEEHKNHIANAKQLPDGNIDLDPFCVSNPKMQTMTVLVKSFVNSTPLTMVMPIIREQLVLY